MKDIIPGVRVAMKNSSSELVKIRSRLVHSPGPRVEAGRKLAHAITINVSYPCKRNDRGQLVLPEMRMGAATLPLLAAIVRAHRPGCQVRQYDEIGTPIDFDYIDGLRRDQTLILLSVSTNLAYEAMVLSRRFQAMGFATVIGGPHASACLEEVAGYANAAVQGEAETHLPSVIEAFEAGALSATTRPGMMLRNTEDASLDRSPIPDRTLYRHSRHYMNPGVLEFGRPRALDPTGIMNTGNR